MEGLDEFKTFFNENIWAAPDKHCSEHKHNSKINRHLKNHKNYIKSLLSFNDVSNLSLKKEWLEIHRAVSNNVHQDCWHVYRHENPK